MHSRSWAGGWGRWGVGRRAFMKNRKASARWLKQGSAEPVQGSREAMMTEVRGEC